MRKYLIPAIALVMIVAGAFTAHAEWVEKGSDYYYYDGNNNPVTNQIVDDEYYVDSTGKMATDVWVKAQDGDGTYYFYFGSNGKMLRDKWSTINDKTYHFDADGHMETGWILDNMYFCHLDDGHMLTGWQRLEDPTEDEGRRNDPMIDDSNIHWYYFGASGKKYYADNVDFIEKRIDDKRYCFNNLGQLQTGWVKFGNDAEGIGDYKYYDENGTDHVGWYSLNPPEDLANNYAYDVMWFYFNSNGVPAYDTDGIPTVADLKRINNKRYYFNVWGTPVWGLCKLYTNTDGSDYETYFFGTFNQSCVQHGKFQIYDGTEEKASFSFAESGCGTTGVKDGSLYYKGLLQKASKDCTYEVIHVNNNNYLVSTAGKIEKNKSSIKDKDGNKWTTNSAGIVTHKDGAPYSGNGRDPEQPSFQG